MFRSRALRWLLLSGIVLAAILVPFFLFGESLETWIGEFIKSAKSRPLTAACVLAGLLVSDILLPIPSSIVSMAAGYVLGLAGGTLTSLIGMTVSCVIGFWLGRVLEGSVVRPMVGEGELKRLEELSHRFGDWIIVICRPVPVLAEASVLFAGMSGMSVRHFLVLSTLANLGISTVYAAVGAYSADVNSFFIAFGGSVIIPAVAMFLMRRRGKSAPSFE
jgi:uncharacterized membrane protein YdjX (TVP38/TMEM64 family)